MLATFSPGPGPTTITRERFRIALEQLGGSPQIIVETGSSAWGTDSTRFWDSYIRAFGGEVWTVELSPSPRKQMRKEVSPNTNMIVGDSVAFLKRLVQSWPLDRSLGLSYLDGFDLDWKDPEMAAQHRFDEWLAVEPLLTTGSLLLIDDTPGDLRPVSVTARQPALAYRKETGLWPHKGNRVVRQIVNSGQAQLLYHGYSALF